MGAVLLVVVVVLVTILTVVVMKWMTIRISELIEKVGCKQSMTGNPPRLARAILYSKKVQTERARSIKDYYKTASTDNHQQSSSPQSPQYHTPSSGYARWAG